MDKSTALSALLAALTQAARAGGLNDSEWAARAGLRKETLSRLRRRSTCDFATLEALAEAVGLRIGVGSALSETSPQGDMPTQLDRSHEERLLQLCASKTLDAARWKALGPGFFMAGLAVMLASVPGFDRRNLLALGERLHVGMSEPAVFARWLARSPVRPARFLPMLEMGVRNAA
jgi:DNA-binding phage protein